MSGMPAQTHVRSSHSRASGTGRRTSSCRSISGRRRPTRPMRPAPDTTQAAAFWEGGARIDHELADPPNARLARPVQTSRSAVRTEPARTSGPSQSPQATFTTLLATDPLAVVALLAVVLAGGVAVLVSGPGHSEWHRSGRFALGGRMRPRAVTKAVTDTRGP